MSGSFSALISGKASPVQHASYWDHTFVVSDCGWVWRCWGNYTNGTILSQNEGNSFIANCISHPDGTAGIRRYGVDGVCHQTANRILLPALIDVSEARGYNLSESFFEAYGTDFGPWLAGVVRCWNEANDPGRIDPYVGPDRQRQAFEKAREMSSEPSGSATLAEMLEFAARGQKSEADRVAAMCSACGVMLSTEKLNQLVRLRFFVRQDQRAYAFRLKAGEISREDYWERMQGLIEAFVRDSVRLLGEKSFHQIFGDSGFDAHKLIDSDIFFANGEMRHAAE